jgi:4-hydroxy-tetrahydrodipicolinate synthase
MTEKLEGIYAAVLTPIGPDGDIDVPRWAAHCRWLMAQGCHGLGVFGTTGETNSFSVEQRVTALEALLAEGIPADALMVGTGCCAAADTIRLTAHALDQGCSKVLALPPFYYKNNTDEGLFRAFAEVIEALGGRRFRLLLYHFPQMSGVPVTTGVVDRLLEAFPGIMAGMKDSQGDRDHTLGLIDRYPQLAIFPGTDTLLLDGLRAGGAGTISAAANINAAGSRRVFDAHASGDDSGADEGQRFVTAVREIIQRYPPIPALKTVVATGLDDPAWTRVRPPLVPLPSERVVALLGELKDCGYTFDKG